MNIHKKARLSEKDWVKAANLYRKRLSIRQIAKCLYTSANAVQRHLHLLDVPMRPRGRAVTIPGLASKNAVLSSYKKSAQQRGLTWKLSRADFEHLTAMPCRYCGLAPSNQYRAKGKLTPFIYTGIDRMNNLKGYTRANVVPACAMCNYAKTNKTAAEFIVWINRIARYRA